MISSILTEYIKEGEHLRQDFKFRIDDQKKIARTLAAFANSEGGRLLIGVKDNGKITGIEPQEELHMIAAAADLFCSPVLPFNSKLWQEGMKLVLEIEISKNDKILTYAKDEEGKWKVYVRRDDHTLIANKILVEVLKKRSKIDSRPEKIDSKETELLGLISHNEPITLSKIYRLSSLSKKEIDRLLVVFICWELLDLNLTETGSFFSIHQQIT